MDIVLGHPYMSKLNSWLWSLDNQSIWHHVWSYLLSATAFFHHQNIKACLMPSFHDEKIEKRSGQCTSSTVQVTYTAYIIECMPIRFKNQTRWLRYAIGLCSQDFDNNYWSQSSHHKQDCWTAVINKHDSDKVKYEIESCFFSKLTVGTHVISDNLHRYKRIRIDAYTAHTVLLYLSAMYMHDCSHQVLPTCHWARLHPRSVSKKKIFFCTLLACKQ